MSISRLWQDRWQTFFKYYKSPKFALIDLFFDGLAPPESRLLSHVRYLQRMKES